MEDIARITLAFTRPIEINTKRSNRYTVASRQFQDSELKALFLSYSQQSQSFNHALGSWLSSYDKNAQLKKDSVSIWEKLKNTFALDPTKDLSIYNCELMEEEVLRIYKTVMVTSTLPFGALKDIEKQLKEIEKACNTFKLIRNKLARQPQAA